MFKLIFWYIKSFFVFIFNRFEKYKICIYLSKFFFLSSDWIRNNTNAFLYHDYIFNSFFYKNKWDDYVTDFVENPSKDMDWYGQLTENIMYKHQEDWTEEDFDIAYGEGSCEFNREDSNNLIKFKIYCRKKRGCDEPKKED